jgi:hypothetical protein
VKELGLRAAFINAYRPLFFRLKSKTQWRLSATTVANLAAELPFFTLDDIVKRRSLYHDFTNQILVKRGFSVPLFTPEQAGQILSEIAQNYDFTLYEYFLTDMIGHSQKIDLARAEILKLDTFLKTLLHSIDLKKHMVILTSDHGNIEDLSIQSHTRNQVMTLLWGPEIQKARDSIQSIEDITPFILHWMMRQ